MAEELLESVFRRENVIRLIFFTLCSDNQEYQLQRNFLEQWVDKHFVAPRPLVSLVAQKPLAGELILEVHSLEQTADEAVVIEEQETAWGHYLRIKAADYLEVVAGGLCAGDLNLPICEQSEQAFRKAEESLRRKG